MGQVGAQDVVLLGDLLDGRPDAERDGRAGPLDARAAAAGPTPEAEGLAQLGDQRVELELGPLGSGGVVGLVGLIDVALQVEDPRLVLPTSPLVEGGARAAAAHVGGAHELEAVDLLAGSARAARRGPRAP